MPYVMPHVKILATHVAATPETIIKTQGVPGAIHQLSPDRGKNINYDVPSYTEMWTYIMTPN
jgi:hypothetical protein